MNIKVLYGSRSGNTAKIATAIASACGVQAQKITAGMQIEDTDLLFIGDGIYAGKPNNDTQALLEKLSSANIKSAAVFGTYGGGANGIANMKDALKAKGIQVYEETYGCRGKAFFFLNRSHPDATDLENAKKFADSILSQTKGNGA